MKEKKQIEIAKKLLKKNMNINEIREITELTLDEIKQINEEYRFKKLNLKKEINRKENRNYHINLNNPNEIKKYLEYNKKIHKDGLKSNIIFTSLLILLNLFISINPILFISLILFEIMSIIINFECINLQNYNLCRLENKKTKKVLKKLEEKKNKNMIKNMSKGSKVIGDTFRNTVDIPTIDDIINNIKEKEEAVELLNYTKNNN